MAPGSKSAGKAGKKAKKDEAAPKESKESKKAAREAAEAERERELEAMLAPDDEAATDSEGEWTTDKAGNRASKAAARKKAEEDATRAAAKQRRALKATAAPVAAIDEGRPQWLVDYDRVKAKAAGGGKLSGKERKLFKRGQAREAEEAELGLTADGGADTRTVDARLEGFALSLPGGAGSTADDNSRDVVVKGFSISAPDKPLLVNADLALVAGRRYGLVGANGRGKSTLLRFIAARRLPVPKNLDILLVDQEANFQGASVLEDVLEADTTRSKLLAEEAALWNALDDTNVERLAQVCDELEAIDADAAEGRAHAVLAGLGFSAAMVAGPASKLSGGWRVRAALARALFAPPRLLLLDEPTNHLDLDAVIWLERYITDLLPASSTLLTVSHDRGFLDEVSTDFINLSDDGGLSAHRGGLAKLDKGATARLAKRTRDYALQRKTLIEERQKHPSLNADKLAQRVLEALGAPRLVEKPREYAVHFDLTAPADARTAAGLCVDLRGVAFSFGATSTGFSGFKDLDLSVDGSTRAAIVGANGSGKSTLLKLIVKELTPTEGEVTHGRRLTLGYYDQHFSELKACSGKDSAVEFLVATHACKTEEARKFLGKFGLDSARHVMPVRDLSGGQKARVVFASLALKKPHLLVLDEPTNHLDIESCDALVEGLRAYEGGVLAVTHDEDLIKALSSDENGVELPLFVCRESTVCVERGGFNKYRKDVAKAADEREAMARELADARAAKRAADRRVKLAKAAKSAANRPPKPPP